MDLVRKKARLSNPSGKETLQGVDLPETAMEIILSYLLFQDQLKMFAMNKAWKSAMQQSNPIIITDRELFLCASNLRPKRIQISFSKAISFPDEFHLGKALSLDNLLNSKMLRTVKLDFTMNSSVASSLVNRMNHLRALCENKGLQSLILTRADLICTNLRAFVSTLRQLKQLRTLSLEGMFFSTDSKHVVLFGNALR
jgi:hypothetical protein